MYPGTGYCPAKGAGGNAGRLVRHALDREGAGRAGEAPRPAGDGRDLDDRDDVRVFGRGIALSGLGRENAVSVGRDEGNRANAAPKIDSDIDLFLVSRGISAGLGSISRCGPRYEQDRELNLVRFD